MQQNSTQVKTNVCRCYQGNASQHKQHNWLLMGHCIHDMSCDTLHTLHYIGLQRATLTVIYKTAGQCSLTIN